MTAGLVTAAALATSAGAQSPTPVAPPPVTSPPVASPPVASPTLTVYKSLALSPDGKSSASVEGAEAQDTALPDTHGKIVVRSSRNGAVASQHDPCATCTYAGTTWSPNGRNMAFIATDSKAGTATLYVAIGSEDAVAGQAVRSVARVSGVAQTPRWSPDGRRIAMLVVAGAHKVVGAVEAGRAQVGEIGEADDEQRIAVVDVSGSIAAANPTASPGSTALHFVSPADTFVYEYGWTPDGSGFVATAAKGNGDNNWWVAKLVAVDGASGSVRTIAAPSYQMDMPRVSPDGSRVLFIGGLMSDFGSVGGDLYEVPFAGGTPRNLTEGAKATVTSLSWASTMPIVTRLAGDRMEIARVTLAGGAAKLMPLWSAPVSGSAQDGQVAVAANGSTIASVLTDFTHPPEINVAALSSGTGSGSVAFRPVTTGNAQHPALVNARSINWTSDGRAVQGWLVSPVNPKPGKSAMIVEVHGGPSAATTPSYVWNGLGRALIDHGYTIFLPNPRGSYGQGEAFTRANVRDFGGGDLRDIQAGVDAVLKVAAVDPARLGIYGHSYGGFMTMWTVTHSTRFKAAVAGAGIANWISYYGQNGIDQWMIPFFGASAYDDPEVYRADSPISTIKAAKTPTLIYVGERDVECPAAQSVEFWHGLKAMGVPTSLVIYAGEGHRLRKPVNVHDREKRIVDWFDQRLR